MICWKGFRWPGRGRRGRSSSCRRSLYDRTRLLADGIGAGPPPGVLYIQGSMAEPRTRPHYSYRDDPAVPRFDDRGPVAIMDGECVLRANGARAIARFDRERSFRIGRTQSALGAALVRHYGLEPDDPETWLYLEDGRAWSGMEAIIRVGVRVGGPGWLLGALRVFPRPAREWLYGRIARNRYWFGRTDMCALPDPGLSARLIE
jgi:predicted DCC family thiol-disulfide oxidoreductase YuxK